MQKILKSCFFCSILTISLLLVLSIPTEALTITSNHLVIDRNENIATVTLINSSDKTEKYRISFVEMTMTPKGELKRVKEPEKDKKYASDLVIFSPRRVKLPPNTSQKVRLQVQRALLKREEYSKNEYRSHLLFSKIPLEDSGPSIESSSGEAPENEDKEKKELKIQLKLLMGVSIPVIVRRGKTHAEVELTDLRLINRGKTPKLDLTIRRSGNRSVYGKFKVTHISKDGEKKQVGIIKGISVYTCLKKRNLQIALDDAKDVDLSNGFLQVTYRQPSKYGGKLIAEAQVQL